MKGKAVTVYALSSCLHCRKAKEYLDRCNIQYSCVYVDQAQGDERRSLIDTIKKCNPRLSFPTIMIGEDIVIVGFNEKKLQEAIAHGQ